MSLATVACCGAGDVESLDAETSRAIDLLCICGDAPSLGTEIRCATPGICDGTGGRTDGPVRCFCGVDGSAGDELVAPCDGGAALPGAALRGAIDGESDAAEAGITFGVEAAD